MYETPIIRKVLRIEDEHPKTDREPKLLLVKAQTATGPLDLRITQVAAVE